jgi:hypothetical protein
LLSKVLGLMVHKQEISGPGGAGQEPEHRQRGLSALRQVSGPAEQRLPHPGPGRGKVIPSFVSLEPFKERTDFRWQILASAFGIVPHTRFRWADGELAGFRSGVASEVGDSEPELVEDSPKIIGGFKDDVWQVFRQRCRKFDLMNVCGAVGIPLHDMGPWLILSKNIDFDQSGIVHVGTYFSD